MNEHKPFDAEFRFNHAIKYICNTVIPRSRLHAAESFAKTPEASRDEYERLLGYFDDLHHTLQDLRFKD